MSSYPLKNINTPPSLREFDEALMIHLIIALQPLPRDLYDEVHVVHREYFISSYQDGLGRHAPTLAAYCN